MSKKPRSLSWWVVSILIAGAAGLAGYRLGLEMGAKEVPSMPEPGIIASEKPVTSKVIKPASPPPVDVTPEEVSPAKTESGESADPVLTCAEMEKEIRNLCSYLDTKGYVRHLDTGTDTYTRLQDLVGKLSSNPPIPAGEGIDPRIMISNIYHFFRHMEKTDIRLIKDVLANEEEALEFNLELLYNWLTRLDECLPSDEEGRPLDEALYQYAGYFLNTVGGRAYLFRRNPGLRLLISYYSVLTIHAADLRQQNSYGIDLFPILAPLLQEMRNYPDFHFRDKYIRTLNGIQAYYLNSR